jgi:peptidoglycan/LPS O-acetylase OafA/YrhL
LAKIYPLHVLTFIIALPLVLYGAGSLNQALGLLPTGLQNLFLVQSYIPDARTYYSFNTVSWSIADEVAFYLMFPLLLAGLVALWRRTKPKAALTTLWLGVLLIDLAFAVFGQGGEYLSYILPAARLPDFMAGILLGVGFVELPRLKLSTARATCLELGVLAMVIGAVLVAPLLPQAFRYSLFFVPFWSALIYTFAHQGGLVSRLLAVRSLVFLGEISFSFYMIHFLVIRYLRFTPLQGMVANAVALALAMAISAVLFRFYEEPVRRKLTCRLRTRAAGRPSITAESPTY